MTTATLLIALIAPGSEPIRVDAIERNYVYDGMGELRLDQVMGWKETGGEYHVDWWHYSKDMHGLRKTPYGWRCSIKGRVVESRRYYETWTQWDREIDDHQNYPPEFREKNTWP